MDEEAETKAIEKWLRMVDKPLLIVVCARLHMPFAGVWSKKLAYPPGSQFEFGIFALVCHLVFAHTPVKE